MRRARPWIGSIALIAVVGATVVAAARFLPFLRAAESSLADARIAFLFPPVPVSNDLAVVTITEESFASLPYRSPVDRELLAGLIDTLCRYRVRAIGLDLIFDQATEPHKDRLLSAALRRCDVNVVVAQPAAVDRLPPSKRRFFEEFAEPLRRAEVTFILDRDSGMIRRTGGKEGASAGLAGSLAEIAGAAPAAARGIDFRRAAAPTQHPFPVYPAHMLERLPASWFENRVVLVGVDITGVDRHRIPLSLRGDFDPSVAGVIVHGQLLAQLLAGRERKDWPLYATFILVLAAAAGGLVLVASFARTLRVVAGGLALLLVFALLALYLSHRLQWMPPLIAPMLAFVLTVTVEAARQRYLQWRRRRFIEEAFGRYVSPAVVDALIEDPSNLSLRSERREITSLFTDIAGFTASTERSDPADMERALATYLSGAIDVINGAGGTIDKIIGDAFHVLFNAPLPQDDHAAIAIDCALALDRYSQSFRQTELARKVSWGETRIGIHSGPALVGNFGGERFFDYTAYGTTINTASRLESANKIFGTRILASADTVRRCHATDVARPAGEVLVRGRQTPVTLFEIAPADDQSRAPVDRYTRAYRELAGDRIENASRSIAELAEMYNDDPLVAFYSSRLADGLHGTLIRAS